MLKPSYLTQLTEAKEKIKILQARVHLYESGVTDKSIHASQTNIGLINLANEENNECDCRTSGDILIMNICVVLRFYRY